MISNKNESELCSNGKSILHSKRLQAHEIYKSELAADFARIDSRFLSKSESSGTNAIQSSRHESTRREYHGIDKRKEQCFEFEQKGRVAGVFSTSKRVGIETIQNFRNEDVGCSIGFNRNEVERHELLRNQEESKFDFESIKKALFLIEIKQKFKINSKTIPYFVLELKQSFLELQEFDFLFEKIKEYKNKVVFYPIKFVLDLRKVKKISFEILDFVKLFFTKIEKLENTFEKICVILPKNKICRGFLRGCFLNFETTVNFKAVKSVREVDSFIKKK